MSKAIFDQILTDWKAAHAALEAAVNAMAEANRATFPWAQPDRAGVVATAVELETMATKLFTSLCAEFSRSSR